MNGLITPTMILQSLKKHHFFFAHVEVEGINVNHNDGNKIVNCSMKHNEKKVLYALLQCLSNH